MEKQSVILRITASIDFGQETISWMQSLTKNMDEQQQHNLWFTRNKGQDFLNEFQRSFQQILVEEIDSEVQSYFRNLKLSEEFLPHAKVTETYIGSLTIMAVVSIAGTIGGTFAALKGISEIPTIIEGLKKLKVNIANSFKAKTNSKVHALLTEQAANNNVTPPPSSTIELKDFVIDARPLLALTPNEMKSHSLHLQAGISTDSFTLENLGADTMRDIKIGLFVGDTGRNHWSIADAFVSSVNVLSPHQTISKQLSDFVHDSKGKLSMIDLPAHVDCWVQDSHGIYLFNFYLEK